VRLRQKAPKQREAPRNGRAWWLVAGAALVLAAGGAYLALGGGSTGTREGLPQTPDYHSLLVASADAQTLLLGTHNGLYRSADGGRTWNAYTPAIRTRCTQQPPAPASIAHATRG
jgi:hypothetical protein